MRILPKEQDWTPYAWLIYLVYFGAVPFAYPTPLWLRIATLATTVIALPIYFAGYWLKDRRVLWVVAAFVALGLALAPFNPGASVLFIYGASYLGKVFPPKPAYQYLVGILAAVALESALLALPLWNWIPSLTFTALVGSVIIQQYQRRRLADSLLLAQDEAQRLARVAERERIGRDLHDLLGHTLSVIVLKSELASKLAEIDI
ncbi:MAG: histidine kinase, partial [Acidobacteriota bacterium]